MDLNWSEICLKWAKNLGLGQVNDTHSLSDGKFFYNFMLEYLDRAPNPETTSETFQEINRLLNHSFQNANLVNLDEASVGSEDELLKTCTLFMFIGTVVRANEKLINYHSNEEIFSNSAQFRIKCLLKAISEQRSMLTADLLLEMMTSRVSEMTGQLEAPVSRSRLASTQLTRIKKASPGSPVIFAYSPGSSSPNKDNAESPVSSQQIGSLKSALEERTTQVRELRVELDGERGEKQFAQQELEQAMNENRKLEQEVMRLKQERRDQQNKEDLDSSVNLEAEFRDKYHQVLEDKRRLGHDLASLQANLDSLSQEKETVERRCEYLNTDLSKTRTEKHSIELTIEEMTSKLNTTETINSNLKKNIDELQGQLTEMTMFQQQSLSSSILSGRPSIANVNFMKCDMTNMSMDADESLGCSSQLSPTQPGMAPNLLLGGLSPGGENMGDIVIPELKEKIEKLQIEIEREREEKKDLEKNLQTIDMELKTTLAKLDEASSVAETTQAKLDLEVDEKQKLSSLLVNEQSARAELESDLGHEIAAKKDIATRLDEEKGNTAYLNNCVTELEANLKTETAAKDQLKTLLEEQKVKTAKLDTRNGDLETSLMTEVAAKDDLKTKLNEEISKTAELNSQVRLLNSKVENEIAAKELSIGALEGEKARTVALESTLAQTRTEMNAKNVQLEELTASQALLDKEVETLELGAKLLKENNEKLQASLEEVNSELLKEKFSANALQKSFDEQNAILVMTKQQCQLLTEEKSSLEAKVEGLQQEATSQTDEIARVNEALAYLECKLKEQDEKLIAAKSNVDNLKQEKANVEKKLSSLDTEKQTLIDDLQVEKAQLLETVQNKISMLEEIDQEAMRIKADFEDRICKRDEELMEKDKQVNSLQSTVKGLENNLGQAENGLKNTQEENTRLQGEKEILEVKVAEIEQDRENIKQELAVKTSEFKCSKEVLLKSGATLEGDIVKKTGVIEMLAQEKNELEKELDIRLSELSRAGNELGQLKARIADLESSNADTLACHERERADKQAELTKTTADLDKTMKQMTQVSEAFQRIEEEVERVQEEKVSLTETLRQSDAEKLELKTRLEEISAAANASEQQLAGLRADLKEVTEAKATADLELKEANSGMDAYADKLKETRDCQSELTSRVSSLQSKLEILQAECEEHVAEKENLKTIIEELRKRLQSEAANFEAEKDGLTKSRQEYETLANQLEAELKEERQNTAQENAAMEESLMKIEANRQDLEIEKTKLQETLAEMGANFDSKTKEIRTLAEKNSKLEEQLSSLTVQLNGESTETKHRIEFLQSELEDRDNEKEALKNQVIVLEDNVTHVNNKLMDIEKERDIEISQKERLTKELKENNDKVDELLAVKKEMETAIATMKDENISLADKNSQLENQLVTENRTKEGLATNLSELITNCNSLKDTAQKERDKMQDIAHTQGTRIKDLELKLERAESEMERTKHEKQDIHDEKEAKDSKIADLSGELTSYKERVEQLEKDLAKSEIAVTDLQQEMETKGTADVKEALEEQRKRYEARVQEIRDVMSKDARKQIQTKLAEKLKDKEAKITKKEEEISGLREEVHGLKEKMSAKVSQLESLHSEEVEVYRQKYQECQQQLVTLKTKYEVAKDLIKNQRQEKENMSAELNQTRNKLSTSETESVKRELVQIKNENRRLTIQLSHADIQLREHKKRESSSGRLSTSTRSSNSSLNSHPGRATRQSTSNLPDEADSVFKLPSASHTPGRTKTGRTVSETRMGGRRTRPPHGAGNLFNCEEEDGEMFSNSYLTDLKDGRCDVTNDDGRMSELARRNTLCLPHLKSSYPAETQFCTDEDITEDAIRQSKVKPSRNTDFPLPFSPSSTHSPVANLSKATVNLTLDSPAANTRSSRPVLPKPVAFTVEAPGRTDRRLTMTKQPCKGEHGVTKKECTGNHPVKKEKPLLEETVTLSPDYQRQTRKRKSDQTKQPDLEQIKRAHLAPPTRQENPEPEKKPDVQLSPDSDTSSLSRDSVRGSKRYKKEAGNISYNKPGPPTPSRNKSLNRSRHETSSTSLDSAPVDATPNISRASTRSGMSATPLLETTNTPSNKQNKSKMTPLRFKSIVGSAFKRGKYRLMNQENNKSGLAGASKSPLKAKDKKFKKRT